MEQNTVYWIIGILIVLALIIYWKNTPVREGLALYRTYPWSPFSGDYGYIAEHEFLKKWYNSPYFQNVPNYCIIPSRTNPSCVWDALRRGRSYNAAIVSCTSPPSVDASCY